jgi:hypothetical protein
MPAARHPSLPTGSAGGVEYRVDITRRRPVEALSQPTCRAIGSLGPHFRFVDNTPASREKLNACKDSVAL